MTRALLLAFGAGLLTPLVVALVVWLWSVGGIHAERVDWGYLANEPRTTKGMTWLGRLLSALRILEQRRRGGIFDYAWFGRWRFVTGATLRWRERERLRDEMRARGDL